MLSCEVVFSTARHGCLQKNGSMPCFARCERKFIGLRCVSCRHELLCDECRSDSSPDNRATIDIDIAVDFKFADAYRRRDSHIVWAKSAARFSARFQR